MGERADALTAEGNGWWSGSLPARPGLGPGAEYKFVLRLQNGEMLWKPDPWARLKRPETLGNSILYDDADFQWTDANWTAPKWDELVIYELHVGTFGRGPAIGLPANFSDCTRFLEYLVELGVNAVELLPVAEFDGAVDMGYTSSYIYAVENTYGGPDAFKRFVDKCHAFGLAVILDVVYNHWGPMDLPLWQFDGWHDGANLGGIWFYNDRRAETPWGHTRPNYGQAHVREYIEDNALFWLETMHCDGLRVDGLSFIRLWGGDISRKGAVDNPDGVSLLRSMTSAAEQLGRPRLLIAEDLTSNASVTALVAADGLGFHSQWDAAFRWSVRQALASPAGSPTLLAAAVGAVRNALLGRPRSLAAGTARVIYTESHDDAAPPLGRLPHQAASGAPGSSWWAKKASALGACIVLTAPGIPMLFQGQEFFETADFQPSEPLDWSRLAQHPGLFRLYQELVALRRDLAGRSRGLLGAGVEAFGAGADGVVAYRRWAAAAPGEAPAEAAAGAEGSATGDVLVVLNLRSKALVDYRLGLPLQAAGAWQLALNSDDPRYDREFGAGPRAREVIEAEPVPSQGLQQSAPLSLGPRSCAIYLRPSVAAKHDHAGPAH